MFSFWHQASNIFDEIYKGWTGQATMRALGTTMVTAYITILVLIGLARQGMLPGFLVPHMPTRYFYAVNIVFTLLLYIELIDLILGLSYSVSRALAKQFEIFSMILLRQSFKEFSNITPP
ncbi:hypothetical protein DENIS_3865 [Desulfonema ishimotonii]|uniref:Uncharacterized protein n=1 Tax=Desulfonema ishimotonii TaxID=45657 RepID=A0A401G0Z1_9BACT|nr:hypothetical protein [Desulfonema ishimotonii]GBC62881.1 hypothetical protein DENIS_3865 [Desulfonema ishimotonii]